MELSTLQIVLIFLVSGLAGVGSVLDEFQFHRPLIACTLMGLILGDITKGIMIGATLEMIALGWMNIGAAAAPDAALASTISTIIVIAGKQDIQSGIALAIPIAVAGQLLTIFTRTITVIFQHAADKAAEKGKFRTLEVLHISALSLQFLRVAIPTMVVAFSIGTTVVKDMLASIPDWLTGGLNVAGGMIVVVGYAMVINMMKSASLMPFLFLGFVVAAFTNFNLIGLGILGIIMAIIYLQLSPQFNKQEVVVVQDGSKSVSDDDLDDELD